MRKDQNQAALEKEPLAGLIRVALARGDRSTAARYADEVASYLSAGGTLDGTEEPLRIYLACYNALAAEQDPRCGEILKSACGILNAQASKISVLSSRRRFIDNVSWRRELMEHSARR
jgi:hypothetical protein